MLSKFQKALLFSEGGQQQPCQFVEECRSDGYEDCACIPSLSMCCADNPAEDCPDDNDCCQARGA